MKKLFLFVLVTVLLLSLCSCQKSGNPAATDEAPAVTAVAEDNTVIDLYEIPATEAPVSEPADTGSEAVESKIDYKAFEGDYNDEMSQRAYLTARENPDWESVNIVVCWSSSAMEYTRWEMDATYEDDKLVYSNCLEREIYTDEDGNSTEKVIRENGSGFFEWDDGIMKWTGAEDPDCQECVFVR